MRIRTLIPLLALASLGASTTAQAEWFDYLDKEFDSNIHYAGPEHLQGLSHANRDHEAERIGLVFVHGMGPRDCTPERVDNAQTNWERLGLGVAVQPSEVVLEGIDWGLDNPHGVAGELSDNYDEDPGGKGQWLMRPAPYDTPVEVTTVIPGYPPMFGGPGREDEVHVRTEMVNNSPCWGPKYWGTYMLNQTASDGRPDVDMPDRVPTLIAGYDAKDAWYGERGEPPAYTVARQINAFIDAYDLEKVTIVAHSMGGVVVRDLFTQAAAAPSPADLDLGPDYMVNDHYSIQRVAHRTQRVIAIASPQRGSYAADLAIDLLGGAELEDYANPIMLGLEELGSWVVDQLGYDRPSTRSLTTTNMILANQNRLLGTVSPLPVDWFNIYGTRTSNEVTETNEGHMRDRQRRLICGSRANDYNPFDGDIDQCSESEGLYVTELATEGGATDGFVDVRSASYVGTNIFHDRSNHHHNRQGDLSYSLTGLDEIGVLRYFAFASAPYNLRFEDDMVAYGDPFALGRVPPPPPTRPRPPATARLAVGDLDAQCSTTAVVGPPGWRDRAAATPVPSFSPDETSRRRACGCRSQLRRMRRRRSGTSPLLVPFGFVAHPADGSPSGTPSSPGGSGGSAVSGSKTSTAAGSMSR